jgi:ABC-2 type transport system permease protein
MSPGRLTGLRVRLEVRSLARNPQAAFYCLLLPLALVVVLGVRAHGTQPGTRSRYVDLETAGLITFALINTCYLTLTTSLVSLRESGVLKRMRSTPLSPGTFLAGQIGATMLLAALVTSSSVLVGALALGSAPRGPTAWLAFTIGTATAAGSFAALGCALTTVITSANAAGPIAQATYLPLSLTSGVFLPGADSTGITHTLSHALPVGAAARVLQGPFTSATQPWRLVDLLVVLGWGAAGLLIAKARFRWW